MALDMGTRPWNNPAIDRPQAIHAATGGTFH
jgi:hypothetical protein